MRVASDRSLRRALGGTATSLKHGDHPAIQWLTVTEGCGPVRHPREKRRGIGRSRGCTLPRANTIVDLVGQCILEFVCLRPVKRAAHLEDPGLRSLRDAGMACERGGFQGFQAKG